MLSLIVDEELCIVNGFGQGPVLVPKLCKVQPSGRENKPRVPDRVMRSESRASSGVLAEERDCGPDRSRMATGLASSSARGKMRLTKVAMAVMVVFSREA